MENEKKKRDIEKLIWFSLSSVFWYLSTMDNKYH